MDFYDVVIVGAGPAGLNCAKQFLNSNIKVLILEKNKTIGPKICAGGLTGKDIEYLNIPKKLIEYSYKEIELVVKNKREKIVNETPFAYTIDRKKFGQWQLSQLNTKNIRVKTNTKVTKITKGTIELNNKEKIKFKYLVGADGSNSLVRKFLKIKSEEKGIAIQHLIPNSELKKFEAFFDSKLFSTWYAWIFPHTNYTSVGCGCNPKILEFKKLKNNYQKWLEKNKINVKNAKYQSAMINYDYQGFKFGNIFLAGDAAGLVSGLTGEGIYPALISGEEIGKIILNKKYSPEKLNSVIRKKQAHDKLLKISLKLGIFRNTFFKIIQSLLKKEKFRNKVLQSIA